MPYFSFILYVCFRQCFFFFFSPHLQASYFLFASVLHMWAWPNLCWKILFVVLWVCPNDGQMVNTIIDDNNSLTIARNVQFTRLHVPIVDVASAALVSVAYAATGFFCVEYLYNLALYLYCLLNLPLLTVN